MKKFIYLIILLTYSISTGNAQDCDSDGNIINEDSIVGSVFFNYGGIAVARSTRNNASITVGETFVGDLQAYPDYMSVGFFSRFLLPPVPPVVSATQGELADRIQVTWQINSLGSFPSGGFNLYRDNIFIDQVGPEVRNYIDFNAIAGLPYTYTVRGINVFGEGPGGSDLGFMVPNGVVTGLVETLNGNPVPDAMVTLTPMQGYSLDFGSFDGATASVDSLSNSLIPDNADWSLSFWIKTIGVSTNPSLSTPVVMEFAPIPLTVWAPETNKVTIGMNGSSADEYFTAEFPVESADGWHHIALTMDADKEQANLFLDGELAGTRNNAVILGITQFLNIGSRTTGSGHWEGRLDELRIYHSVLDELDFAEIMTNTAASDAQDLAFYWKMDEEQGTKSFDIVNRHPLHLCGARFDEDRPPVRTSGKTNEDGYYRIDGVSYGTGTTFLARPEKSFLMHRSLKFDAAEMDYAQLPDFALEMQSTIEFVLNSTSISGGQTQAIIGKTWLDQLAMFYLQENPDPLKNDLIFNHQSIATKLGEIQTGYQHVAVTVDGSNGEMTLYENGALIAQQLIPSHNGWGAWADTTDSGIQSNWDIGMVDIPGLGQNYHFDGYIDEIAVYDTTLSSAVLMDHATTSRNPQEEHLSVYFSFDEGSGTRVNNTGSKLLQPGNLFGPSWSPFTANQESDPHEFAPSSRQVTLNPSVTSVDQVDFTDRSTISVSGFVRFPGTNCFAPNIEILVNHESYSPKILTDSSGRFVADFDPGFTAELSPKFEDHVFEPASANIINISTPLTGILFNDLTTRTISGVIAGGSKETCKRSITNPNGEDNCRLTVRSLDGCYEKTISVSTGNGSYTLENLPPLSMAVTISNHNNPNIYSDFQTQGGVTADLTKYDSTDLDFIYVAPPRVEIIGLDDWREACTYLDIENPVVLPQYQNITLDLKVYEQYGPQDSIRMSDRCYLDTAELTIVNTFDQLYSPIAPRIDSLQDEPKEEGAEIEYAFVVDNPTSTPPHMKQMQITADVKGKKSSYSIQALIEGVSVGPTLFTTKSPIFPNYVLRDPPGDGSSAFLEKGTAICNTLSFEEGVGAAFVNSLDLSIGFGADIRIPFYGQIVAGKFTNTSTSSLEVMAMVSNTRSMEYCVHTTEKITTDNNDLIVGGETSFDGGETIMPGSDVYIGTAFNFTFSKSFDISLDNCQLMIDTIATVSPDSFATTYMYSEWNLENNVLRYLQDLVDAGEDSLNNLRSIQEWESFITANKVAKEGALFSQNISWDAGVQYDYSEKIDTSYSSSLSVSENVESLLQSALKVEVEIPGFAVGSELKVGVKAKGNALQQFGDSWERSITTGFSLSDNDPGDTWTVDIKKDPIFKTTVFDVKAGQSSCPWEVGTANREKPILTIADGEFSKDSIPAKQAAVFNLVLGNESGSEEDWTYSLVAFPESNPHGAVIKVNGATLTGPRDFIVPNRGSVNVTLTVERGPVEYDYMGLQIGLVSGCEYQRNQALSFPVEASGSTFYAIQQLDVSFIEPCTDVDLFNPKDGWLLKSGESNLDLTIVDYDKNDPDLKGVRPQYRPSDGNGAWINMINSNDGEIPKAELGSVFKTYSWNTSPLGDGPYEIRTLAICASGDPANNPGISRVISGYIDRQPPALVGHPQPSDGVLNVGDEISFTFNQEIDCASLNAFPIPTLTNNIFLYDQNDQLIEVEFGCYENKITITPSDAFKNELYENSVLRAELHGIKDLSGNEFIPTQLNNGIWEFVIDRNELAWLTDQVFINKYEDETITVTAEIHNRGGYPTPFSIINVPEWVHVYPDTGVLVANEKREIHFEVGDELAFGNWSTDSITLRTSTGQNPFFMGGDEHLPFAARVICHPPDWSVNENDFSHSMNLNIELDIEGELSDDLEDVVGAFINGELVGKGKIEYVPEVDNHQVFLTVFSHKPDSENITFQIWDASTCLLYNPAIEVIPFVNDSIVGTPSIPITIHTNELIMRNMVLNPGWNWVSYNLAFDNPQIDTALGSLRYPEGNEIKNQIQTSIYADDVVGWVGTLTELNNTSMFQHSTLKSDTLHMIGRYINPELFDINLLNGWNHVGYIPQIPLPIDTALASISPIPGDVIKSQTEFAQFVLGQGWVGNLKYMEPLQGYQMRLANGGQLTYPNSSFDASPLQIRSVDPNDEPHWIVEPQLFEHSMVLIGVLHESNLDITSDEYELAAFHDGQVRGVGKAIFIPEWKKWMFFLTIYSNDEGDKIDFKIFDETMGLEKDIVEIFDFDINGQEGSVFEPTILTMEEETTSVQNLMQEDRLRVHPNPIDDQAIIHFLSNGEFADVSVIDVHGRVVFKDELMPQSDWLQYQWNPRNLASGLYFIQVQTSTDIFSTKVVLK